MFKYVTLKQFCSCNLLWNNYKSNRTRYQQNSADNPLTIQAENLNMTTLPGPLRSFTARITKKHALRSFTPPFISHVTGSFSEVLDALPDSSNNSCVSHKEENLVCRLRVHHIIINILFAWIKWVHYRMQIQHQSKVSWTARHSNNSCQKKKTILRY